MSKRIVIFFILFRHRINPFKPMGKILHVMNERLTNNEKDYFIKCAKSKLVKEILYKNLKRGGTYSGKN